LFSLARLFLLIKGSLNKSFADQLAVFCQIQKYLTLNTSNKKY
jgi:hypothetical protein